MNAWSSLVGTASNARRGARVGATMLAVVAAVITSVGAVSSTLAQDGPRLRDLPPDQRRQVIRERFQSLPPEEQDRLRARRREMLDSQGGRPLSPEQRQQLRRDIRDHGRDVYGQRPGGGSPRPGFAPGAEPGQQRPRDR